MKISDYLNKNLLQGPSLLAVILTVGPALCVLAFRFSGPVNPQSAGAANTSPPAVTIAESEQAKATEDQVQTAAAAEAAIKKGFGPSPLSLPPAATTPVVIQSHGQTVNAIDSLTLSSIMSTPRGPMAVISGKPRRIGEEITPGWTLQSIDAAASSVSLHGPESARSTLWLPKAKRK